MLFNININELLISVLRMELLCTSTWHFIDRHCMAQLTFDTILSVFNLFQKYIHESGGFRFSLKNK